MTVGIVGLGLIGGSIAKALRKYVGITDILAYNRRPEPLLEALRDGVISRSTSAIDRSFSDCGIIFICTPVDTIVSYVNALQPFVGKGCILTDVGSTKSHVYASLAGDNSICFIGGHPMAGSEQTGYAASADYLFENAYYILTPSPHAPAEQVETLKHMVSLMGAIPVMLQPKTHDHAVAAISHAPHVIASALVNTVRALDDENETMRLLAAGGFRDITRIASSSPDIWRSISIENTEEILKVLEAFETQIHTYRERLASRDEAALHEFFGEAKAYRDCFQSRTGYMKTWELFVDILDHPGAIATVTTHLSINGINLKNIGVINNREFENGVLQIVVSSEQEREKSIGLLRGLNFLVYVR